MINKKIERIEEKNRKFSKDMPDLILIVIVMLLLGIGLIMVLSTSASSALNYGNTGNFYKQLMFAIAGLIGAGILSRIDYRYYQKFDFILYILSVLVLVLVLVGGQGAKGATRWISIGGFRLQPSEAVKTALIIFNASFITKHIVNIKKGEGAEWKTLILQGVYLAIICLLLIAQPHYSAIIIMCAITGTQILVGGYDLKKVLLSLILLVVILFVALFAENYRIDRLTTFLDPWNTDEESSYQIKQSLYAFGSGGLFGVGLGNSKQKYAYLPEAHNDFIFPIIGEELGFVGCLFVIFLFVGFALRGFMIALRCNNMFGKLVATGITVKVVIQVICNIAAVICLMPVTGISLPFISYGGSALLVQLLEVGILVNISRSNTKKISRIDNKNIVQIEEQRRKQKHNMRQKQKTKVKIR